MNRKHALAVSVLLGLAVAAGAVAATRGGTAQPSPGAPMLSDTAIAQQNARLDRYEASLDRLIGAASKTPRASAAPVAQLIQATPAQTSSSGSGDDRYEDDHSGGGDAYEHEQGGEDD
jgi:hypothetical protein